MIRTSTLFLLLLSMTTLAQAQSGPYCIQGRFAEQPYFSDNEIVEVKDITYGQAMRWPSTTVDTLKMDIYMPDPTIDPLAERPFIMFIHGGAFFAGQREDMASICRDFARRGYVTATMSYRLGWDCDPNSGLLICFFCGSQADKLRVAAYRSVQDARAALRYVAANAGQFGIDASSFFVGGTSAGSVAAIHAAFLDQEQADTFCPDCVPAVGQLDSGVNTIYADYTIQGVLNNCGAVMNLDIFEAGLPMPMISFHDDGDCVVPSGYGYALGCLNCQDFFLAHGSKEMQVSSEQNANCFEMNLRLNSLNHCSYPQSTIVSRSSCFLKSILCGTCESASSNDVNNTASCMDLGTTSVFTPGQNGPTVRIYPNPSRGQAWMDVFGRTSEDQVEVQISNALGQAVSRFTVLPGNDHSIALPFLPRGMYTVIIYQGQSVGQPQRLIIEN
ncbi:MAG: carboxylesterase family protein [Lewinellaceae bacterium]|nr:carboxylesterase family protein [Saprospiraceae bacterium]MCB9311216.1 carboxylesterase family protein [Lewinellaceae bacterium]HRW75627.1 carboxylesterase family protein [Saprospiraceae bacterium]